MIGRLRSTMQRLGLAVALVLAGPSTSHAAPSNASGTGYLNGLPCNDLCKAYMAWSDRIMGRLSRLSPSSRPPPSSAQPPKARIEARIAVRRKRPDQSVDRAAATHHSDLSSLTQILRTQVLRRSNAAVQAAETPQVAPQVTAAAPPAPINAIAERPSAATGIATTRLADDGRATNEPPPTPLDPFIAPVSTTEDTSTTDESARGGDGRLVTSLGLTLCALLSLLYLVWVWFRHNTQAANRIR